MPCSSNGRLRSAMSRRNAWLSGNPRMTVASRTSTGRHAVMRGLIARFLLMCAVTSGHAVSKAASASSGSAAEDDRVDPEEGATWATGSITAG